MIKTILLQTNIAEFANDISEEMRLFLDDIQVVTEAAEPPYATVRVIIEEGAAWRVYAVGCGGFNAEGVCEADAVTGDPIIIKRYKKRAVKLAVFRMMKNAFPNTFVPWGSLTGIRPTKLLRDLEDDEGENAAREIMLGLFGVNSKKYAIAKEAVDIQRPIISSVKHNDIDIYIGIPYCKTRCLYCSFPSGVRTDKTDMKPYTDALKDDICRGARLIRELGYGVRAIYMGGGTPTVLTKDELSEVLDCICAEYGLPQEFTVEAGRPDTINRRKLEILKEHNVGRISINPQSMNDKTLELIGRSHSVNEFIEAYEIARDTGFIINMDIITCLPGEGTPELDNTLRHIEQMRPENFTVHTLALKRSSALKQCISDMESIMPDARVADNMVTRGMECAKSMGMNAYYMYRQKYMRGNLENIGYALPSTECIYNIDMMEETVSIMAHGAGSMSKRVFSGRTLRVERIPNPKDVATYIAKLDAVYEQKRRLFSEGL